MSTSIQQRDLKSKVEGWVSTIQQNPKNENWKPRNRHFDRAVADSLSSHRHNINRTEHKIVPVHIEEKVAGKKGMKSPPPGSDHVVQNGEGLF